MANKHSEFIVIIRPEFMAFCNDACGAASFNHLLFRIAGKCKDKPKEQIQAGKILWYGTTELIREEMAHAWGECKIRQEVNGLVDIGIIGRTKDPNWGVNRTKHFFFGQEQCAKFLELCEKHHICFVHLDLPDEVKHLIYSSNANDKSIKCICPEPDANDEYIKCKSYIHHMQSINVSDANDKSIEAITKKTTKINNKEDNEERESSPNTLDTTAVVSSDTAHAALSQRNERDSHDNDIPSEGEPHGHPDTSGDISHDRLPHRDNSLRHRLPDSEAQAIAPSQQTPQGGTHAPAASGHPHRVGDVAAPGGDSGHTAVDDGQVVAPETGPVLEAGQEITEGEHHATRVPTVPRADHPTPGERAVSRPGSDHSHSPSLPADGLPVVRPVGSGTPGQEAGRDTRDAGRDATQTLTETPTTSTPAQSLPLPQAEQAASGAKQEPKPLVEPDMSGKWSHAKCVEYAEWCNQKRYTEKMHEEQLKAAHAIHKNDVVLTLEQFKQAYDERNDAWWKEHKGKLHVNDMKARGASGIDRVHEMLQRIEDTASKCRAQTPRVLVPAPSPNQPITNIRELVRQRELLRQQQAVGV